MSKPNQDDVISQNATLTKELTEARSEIARLKEENLKLTESGTKHLASVTSLTKERDTLKAENEKLAAENATLISEKTTVEKAVAERLAKFGIRTSGVSDPGSKIDENGLLTQYLAIQNPVERAAFVAKHEAELRKLIVS